MYRDHASERARETHWKRMAESESNESLGFRSLDGRCLSIARSLARKHSWGQHRIVLSGGLAFDQEGNPIVDEEEKSRGNRVCYTARSDGLASSRAVRRSPRPVAAVERLRLFIAAPS